VWSRFKSLPIDAAEIPRLLSASMTTNLASTTCASRISAKISCFETPVKRSTCENRPSKISVLKTILAGDGDEFVEGEFSVSDIVVNLSDASMNSTAVTHPTFRPL